MKRTLQLVATTLFLSAVSVTLSAQVRFNEYSASNWGGQFKDNYNSDEDWFELYNSSAAAADISGYFLSDDELNPTKWEIPAGTVIPANGFILFWCSGRDEASGGSYHTNFRLTQTKAGGEELVFSYPNTLPAEKVLMQITQRRHSWALETDGAATWKVCTTPSPGLTNNGTTQYTGYTARPTMDVPAGFYPGPVTVTISSSEPGVTIRYTTNGDEPKANSPVYTAPIQIDSTTVLKARCYGNSGTQPGLIEFRTYLINESYTLPVVSIAGFKLLELANGDEDIVPIGSIESFDQNEQLVTTSYGELNSHGQDSWANDQRSLDWVSRDEFGYSAALEQKIFSTSDRDQFQRIIFRAAGDDNYPAANHPQNKGSAHVRDDYVQMLAKHGGLDLDVRTSERCIVFLNGVYWGVYSFREKVDDHDYTEYYYNQDKYDLQYVLTWGYTWAEYGGTESIDAWRALTDTVENNDMSNPVIYNYVKDNLDFLSLIDYFCVNTTAVCSDWLIYNTGVWRGFNADGGHKKWGYILWDNDATFGFYINYSGVPDESPYAKACDIEEYDPNGFPNPGGEGHIDLLNGLRENPEFEQLYLSRYADLYNTVYTCENMLNRFDSMIAVIEPEMYKHAPRWYGTYNGWKKNVDSLRSWISQRCTLLHGGLSECYDLSGPYDVVFKVEPPGAGTIKVNTLVHEELPWSGKYFGNMDNLLTAYPAPQSNWQFDHWGSIGGTFNDPSLAEASLQLVAADTIVAYFHIATAVNDPASGFKAGVYPSVFSTSAHVSYTLPEALPVSLDLYSIFGEKIATYHPDGNSSSAGSHLYELNVSDHDLSSGMYILRFNAGKFVHTMKVTIVTP
ncbi:MAG TPA: CotH kinase family protein [Chitinophagales bacterium]|nr:CotH kinase family protein [Chitinophagales bacterium]